MYGARLKSLRRQKKMSIVEVAGMLGVGRSTYGGYEKENRKPSIDMLRRLSEIYGVSTDYILGITDEQDIQKLQYDVSAYLKKGDLNWGGVPIPSEALEPIWSLLSMVVNERLPLAVCGEKK